MTKEFIVIDIWKGQNRCDECGGKLVCDQNNNFYCEDCGLGGYDYDYCTMFHKKQLINYVDGAIELLTERSPSEKKNAASQIPESNRGVIENTDSKNENFKYNPGRNHTYRDDFGQILWENPKNLNDKRVLEYNDKLKYNYLDKVLTWQIRDRNYGTDQDGNLLKPPLNQECLYTEIIGYLKKNKQKNNEFNYIKQGYSNKRAIVNLLWTCTKTAQAAMGDDYMPDHKAKGGRQPSEVSRIISWMKTNFVGEEDLRNPKTRPKFQFKNRYVKSGKKYNLIEAIIQKDRNHLNKYINGK